MVNGATHLAASKPVAKELVCVVIDITTTQTSLLDPAG